MSECRLDEIFLFFFGSGHWVSFLRDLIHNSVLATYASAGFNEFAVGRITLQIAPRYACEVASQAVDSRDHRAVGRAAGVF